MTTKLHTKAPWKVMPCPKNEGYHEYHDNRWVTTADSIVAFGHDERDWYLPQGQLICEIRDGDTYANAKLIAAAPDLLYALKVIQANPNDPYSHRLAMDAMNKAQ